MPHAPIETVQLHAHSAGQGPPVVLLHGLFGSWQNLGALVRALGQHHRVHALDLRNHGRSPHSARHDYPALAADVGAWIEHALGGPCALAGHSMGGKTAMALALERPALIERLAVLDIAPRSMPRGHDAILAGLGKLHAHPPTSRAAAERALTPWVPQRAVRSFLLKNLVSVDGALRWRINLDALQSRYPDIAAWPYRGARYLGPTLFIRGGASDYLRDTDRATVLAQFPAARLKTVAGAGHWLHADKPAVVAKLLGDFLRA